jgi:predicted nicotinamide N-methyase
MLPAMHDYTDPAPAASNADLAAFVRAQTALAIPPLIPELQLYLASALTPLWHATELTLARNGLDPPYWAFAWPGGQAIARYVLDNPDLVRGRCVLDFAAGSGLAGIAAARAGAASVTASELDPIACAAIALNAEANGAALQVSRADLTAGPEASSPGAGWDIILAGDVCYERPMAERVFAWLTARGRDGAVVLMADPGRAYLPPGLTEIARYPVATTREVEGCEERLTRVFLLDQGRSTCRDSGEDSPRQDLSRSSTIR